MAVFRFSHGCYCDPTEIQPLCPQHAYKSGPAKGGTMELVRDLTIDGSFTADWSNPFRGSQRA